MAKNKLNQVKFGLAGGIVTALCVFVTTLAAVIFPGYATSWTNAIASIYGFIGYSASVLGMFLGAVYSFIDGFLLTWIFALIYNKLL